MHSFSFSFVIWTVIQPSPSKNPAKYSLLRYILRTVRDHCQEAREGKGLPGGGGDGALKEIDHSEHAAGDGLRDDSARARCSTVDDRTRIHIHPGPDGRSCDLG